MVKNRQKLQKLTLDDIAKGGRRAFRSVRQPAPPPLAFVTYDVEQTVPRQRWTKMGRDKLQIVGTNELTVGLPVRFQNQDAIVTKCEEHEVTLDRRVKLKSAVVEDLKLIQVSNTGEPGDMNRIVCDAWNKYWQAEEICDDGINGFITCLADCPTCPYQDFSEEGWQTMMKGVNMRSTRGACGFSMADCARLPSVMLQWLFLFYIQSS